MTRRSFGQTILSGIVTKTTDGAALFDPDEGSEFWVPRRVCLDGSSIEEGDTDIVVADWWLEKEGHL